MGQFSLENLFGVTIRESANDGSDFTNPDADYRRLFLGEDGLLHVKDSAGTVTAPYTGGSGTDLNPGTSFPASPSTNELCFRTDLGMLFFYDGTRWLSTQVFTLVPNPKIPGTATTSVGDHQATITATLSSAFRSLVPSLLGGSGIWIVDYKVAFNVNGGTALGASHKWVETINGVADGSAGTSTGTAITVTIDSGASSVFRQTTVAVGAVLDATAAMLIYTWTKTGTPGTLQTSERMTYRIIAT